ncbi:MAG TPA: enoyl-CoA hydratase/isomerase family protein [Chloroflexota bacterium]|nr:enoyl-CoA hydratase/isomerase family protein [Chloroflexota bacterium]
MDLNTTDVIFERRGPVAWLTFNRPQARNALTFAMYDALFQVCEAVEADPEVRVLVITGAGEKAFAAGTDISQFQTFSRPEDALAYEERMEKVIGRLEGLARPTIAAIRGAATGGGASIALACDLRICTPDARIGVPIARTLGNCLSMSNYARLVDLIGPARTKELIFLAKLIEAEEAKGMGLVNEIVPAETLAERVTEVATQIAGHAPLTIQATKEAVRRVLLQRRPSRAEDLVVKVYMSEDFREGVHAFLEKRKPNWQGK